MFSSNVQLLPHSRTAQENFFQKVIGSPWTHHNDEKNPIERVYCFHIEEHAAVYSFFARIDDQEIVAQLKEKKEAQRDYSDALHQGHGAYLPEQDEKSQDNFIINIGALHRAKNVPSSSVVSLNWSHSKDQRFDLLFQPVSLLVTIPIRETTLDQPVPRRNTFNRVRI